MGGSSWPMGVVTATARFFMSGHGSANESANEQKFRLVSIFLLAALLLFVGRVVFDGGQPNLEPKGVTFSSDLAPVEQEPDLSADQAPADFEVDAVNEVETLNSSGFQPFLVGKSAIADGPFEH
jgi:hypothetical protein